MALLTPVQDIIKQNTNHAICDLFQNVDYVTDNQQNHDIVRVGENAKPENGTALEGVNEPNEHLQLGENNENNDIIPENQRMNKNWCGIDVSKILLHRTRSRSVTWERSQMGGGSSAIPYNCIIYVMDYSLILEASTCN